jgi:hypothetical protein
MKKLKWTESFIIGKRDEEYIFLKAPSWDCDWYWSFGYLGNRDCHYHLDTINKDTNLFDTLKEHFGESLTITDDKDLWTFCELSMSAYALKETAEVLGRGGVHYASNPASETIKNEEEVKRINEIVLPEIFEEIHKIISKYE